VFILILIWIVECGILASFWKHGFNFQALYPPAVHDHHSCLGS
jgi:hypothetical protein